MNTDPTGMCLGAYCNLRCKTNSQSNNAPRPNSKSAPKIYYTPVSSYYSATYSPSDNSTMYITRSKTVAEEIKNSPSFNAEKDVVVWYHLDDEKGPNFQVYDSYRITDNSQMKAICQTIIDYADVHNIPLGRTLQNMMTEWRWHNTGYNGIPIAGGVAGLVVIGPTVGIYTGVKIVEGSKGRAQHVDLDQFSESYFADYNPDPFFGNMF